MGPAGSTRLCLTTRLCRAARSCLTSAAITSRIVASVPDDGDVVQGNVVVPEVGSYKRMKIRTSRIVAFVPDDGDVVQGNAVEPYVGSYKRTFWSNRINEVVQGDAICACRLGR